MTAVKSYRHLIVWQKAMDLCVQVYAVAATFPRSEDYRLTNQVLRAAASVPANVAEGHARSTARDYANFIAIAQGSLAELQTSLYLALRLNYGTREQITPVLELGEEVSKMLSRLRQRLMPRAGGADARSARRVAAGRVVTQ